MDEARTGQPACEAELSRVELARVFLAGVFSMAAFIMFNGTLYLSYDGVFDWSRDVSTAMSIAYALAIMTVARKRPSLLRPRRLSWAACIAAACGYALCACGVALASAPAIVAGVVLVGPADIWGIIIWMLCLARLSHRDACLLMATSGLLGIPLAFAVDTVGSYWLANVASAAMSIGVVALCSSLTRGFFARLACMAPPADQHLARPGAYLPMSHTFYVYIFVFSVAYGFALRCENGTGPEVSTLASVVASAGVGLYAWRAQLVSRAAAKEPEDTVYRLYYEFSSPVNKTQGHQILAINRGEREEILKVSVELDRETALVAVRRAVVKPGSAAMDFVRAAAEDAYDRLIAPSMEREVRAALTERADEGAIGQLALNLRPLLMQPPVKGFVTMGLDPGYRMGCKVAVVDPTGKVLDTTVVYPTHGERGKNEAIAKLAALIRKHGVKHIAIGNGTASRETEQMTVELIRQVGGGVSYMIVSEAGASVYSASKLAAEEFPDFDVNLRSAVSIARRLQDPLAELVKIDPKAIGVGQYQHDMPQARLGEALDGVVEDCVNAVGVDVNTASAPLLTRVAGLNGTTAKNIVKYREENGPFTTRKQILKVPKLGPKAFEQCAGFLRVPDSKSPLDNTAVHPESYAAAEKLLGLCGYGMDDVRAGRMGELSQRLHAYGEEKAAEECGVGVPTLTDVAAELMKPGRDPRDELPAPVLRTDVMDMKDLKPGMELRGTVRNVIDFGAFVDIGVHQDGLVHISQIADRYIKHPSEVLSVGDVVTVWVKEVDEKKKRISLTMRGKPV